MSETMSTAAVEGLLIAIKNRQDVIANAEKIRDERIAYFKSLIASAQQIFDDNTKEERVQLEIYKQQLKSFFDKNPPVGRKSYKFAGGTFGYSKSSTSFFFNGQPVDSANKDLLELCKHANGRYVKQKEYLDWAALKKNLNFDDPHHVFLEDTGEVIDGLHAQKNFFVKTN